MFVRSLVLGGLAWLCSWYADQKLKAAISLSSMTLGDWVVFALVRPATILITGMLLTLGCFMLYRVLMENGSNMFDRSHDFSIRMLHACMLAYGLFIASLQLLKFPVFTALFTIVVLTVHTLPAFRIRRSPANSHVKEWDDRQNHFRHWPFRGE